LELIEFFGHFLDSFFHGFRSFIDMLEIKGVLLPGVDIESGRRNILNTIHIF